MKIMQVVSCTCDTYAPRVVDTDNGQTIDIASSDLHAYVHNLAV